MQIPLPPILTSCTLADCGEKGIEEKRISAEKPVFSFPLFRNRDVNIYPNLGAKYPEGAHGRNMDKEKKKHVRDMPRGDRVMEPTARKETLVSTFAFPTHTKNGRCCFFFEKMTEMKGAKE